MGIITLNLTGLSFLELCQEREHTRFSLTYDALKGLTVCACSIQNTCLQAPSSEKHYIVFSPEFGLKNACKLVIIVRDLCDGKHAEADY